MTTRRKFSQARDEYLMALASFTATKQEIADQDIQFCKDNGYQYPMWQIDDEAIFTKAAEGFQKMIDDSGLQELANQAYDRLVASKKAFIETSIDIMPNSYQNEKNALLKGYTTNSTLAQKLIDAAIRLNTRTIPA